MQIRRTKAQLALLLLVVTSSIPPPFLDITLPRYVKRSTSCIDQPFMMNTYTKQIHLLHVDRPTASSFSITLLSLFASSHESSSSQMFGAKELFITSPIMFNKCDDSLLCEGVNLSLPKFFWDTSSTHSRAFHITASYNVDSYCKIMTVIFQYDVFGPIRSNLTSLRQIFHN